jgi:hypothetical protein
MQNQNGNNNNNNNNNQNWDGNPDNYYGSYYIGPYCSPKDGKSIYLGVFYDQGCSVKADDSAYAKNNYDVALPYSATSLVDTDCIACTAVDREQNNNNNNNNNNDAQLADICDQSYASAIRCEEKMEIDYKDTTGCDYITNILPKLESVSRSIKVKGTTSKNKTATAFAVIFGMTTALFAAYAYFLYRKIKRGSVNLSTQE